MSYTQEVKFFNSFILRKAISSSGSNPDGKTVWAGYPYSLYGYPSFPIEASTNSNVIQYDWFVEENRISGEFNGNEVDLGVKAYITNEDRSFKRSSNSLIWSGIYNSRTGVNETNVFSIGEDISTSLNPIYGSIQHIHADENNLTIFQESKVSRALVDRDAIYSAEGRPISTRSDLVVGEIQYYSGDYGISNQPESFASDGNRRYFSDVSNNAILRLSNNGLTEISRYGMEDFFRDEFKRISNSFKRDVIDVSWEILWSTPTTTLTVSGDNISLIEIGMSIEGIVGITDLYVTDVGTESNGEVEITLSKEIEVTSSPQPSSITLVKFVKDKVIGGYDNHNENYVVSVVYNPPSRSEGSGLVDIIPEEEVEPTPE